MISCHPRDISRVISCHPRDIGGYLMMVKKMMISCDSLVFEKEMSRAGT